MSDARRVVVGDIHGCAGELDALLDALQLSGGDTICFLGDYIDRGPDSKGVVARLLRLRREGPHCVFLKGNHEDMFLAFLGAPGRYGEAFVGNGGAPTLASYEIEDLCGPAAAARLPPGHLEFFLALQSSARLGNFFCVHAGVRPTRRLEEQDDEDLFWIREEFISTPHPFPYTILYGHTPGSDVRLDLPFKVGLDTGLVYGNRLSALELPSCELWQITRGARTLHRRNLADQFRAAGVEPA